MTRHSKACKLTFAVCGWAFSCWKMASRRPSMKGSVTGSNTSWSWSLTDAQGRSGLIGLPFDRWSTAGPDNRVDASSLEVALSAATPSPISSLLKPRGYQRCQLEEACFISGWLAYLFGCCLDFFL
ncbi:hypothetical protein NPIL_565931 [Nephila pilipes]|uniref:Uncharacterized protein n=1 Tax=Nephila pilipes TaxID=299642 RepID=A0A8X6R4A7_NEPPI|nr:hypothetical protein NPIL_565931 [Nephila pilipes]